MLRVRREMSAVKLFRAKIEPCCAYCAHSTPLEQEEMGCLRRGIVPMWSHCRRFKYDPFKRVPPRPARLRTDYEEKDFQL
jgi:hypothetical protein